MHTEKKVSIVFWTCFHTANEKYFTASKVNAHFVLESLCLGLHHEQKLMLSVNAKQKSVCLRLAIFALQ